MYFNSARPSALIGGLVSRTRPCPVRVVVVIVQIPLVPFCLFARRVPLAVGEPLRGRCPPKGNLPFRPPPGRFQRGEAKDENGRTAMTTKQTTGTHMKHTSTNQTGRREAPDSSVRPAKSTVREARRAARRLHGGFDFQQQAAHTLALALSTFGGRVIAVETNTQAIA